MYLVPKRPTPLSFNCTDPKKSKTLSGNKRKSPVKMIDMFLFNAELDILEIRLHELNDTVDEFVIIESNATCRGSPKPFYFQRNKDRFSGFLGKIRHIIFPFKAEHNIRGKIWKFQIIQRNTAWSRYIEIFGKPEDDALVIFGDLDEIPSGEAIYHLKHCHARLYPVSSICSHYHFSLNQVLRSDWSADRYAYSIRFPHILDVKSLNGNMQKLHHTRYHVKPASFIGPGAHLSYCAKCAQLILKWLSSPEGSGCLPTEILTTNVTDSAYGCISVFVPPNNFMNYLAGRPIRALLASIERLSEHDKEILYIPWLIRHNRDRFAHLFSLRFP